MKEPAFQLENRLLILQHLGEKILQPGVFGMLKNVLWCAFFQ